MIEFEAEGATESEGSIHGGPGPGQDFARPLRTDQANAPAMHTDQSVALADSKKQPSDDQKAKGSVSGEQVEPGDEADGAGQRVEHEAEAHRTASSSPVGKTACQRSGQNGRDKSTTDDQTGDGIAVARPGGDERGDDRKGHRHSHIGKDQSKGERRQVAKG